MTGQQDVVIFLLQSGCLKIPDFCHRIGEQMGGLLKLAN